MIFLLRFFLQNLNFKNILPTGIKILLGIFPTGCDLIFWFLFVGTGANAAKDSFLACANYYLSQIFLGLLSRSLPLRRLPLNVSPALLLRQMQMLLRVLL